MNRAPAFSQYESSPDATLNAVRAHQGPLLIDFDETLYLRNSTEDFIDCAWPGVLALLLLRLLDVLKPWRWTGGIDTRDNWRVSAISVCFPWTACRWRSRVRFLAARHVNEALKSAFAHGSQASPMILTSGFVPIVAPLLAAMGLADMPLIASRMFSFADRRSGKLRLAVQRLGADTVAHSMAVTDAIEDLELLQSCARPLRTLWPRAFYRRALSDIYLPGEYISKVKHPGERYILRAIVQEDFAFWCLSSIGLAADPALHVSGLLLLLFSFWAIYERGYVDNDLAASRYEADPKLSATFETANVAIPAVQPWIWALLAAAAGTAILAPARSDFALHFALWVGVLVATHACFFFYNRLDKPTRVWIYPLLQFARSAALLAAVPIEPAGAIALGAHMLSRWVPYQVYRLGSSDWPGMQPELIRLICFVLLSAVMACSLGVDDLFTWGALAILSWNLFRARHDIHKVVATARRLDGYSRQIAKISSHEGAPTTVPPSNISQVPLV